MSRLASAAVVTSATATAVTLLAGPGAPAPLVVPLLLLAYVSLAVVVGCGRPGVPRLVLSVGAALLVLAAIRPPMGSHDLWSYAMYGRVVVTHHADPYVVPPRRFPNDPILRRVDPLWRSTRSVYGPVFTAWAAGVAALAGRSTLALRLGFQLLALAAVGLATYVVDRRTRGDPGALALIVLNPLVVCSLVNDGHVDALVGLLVLGAALALERHRSFGGGVLFGLAALVKASAILPAAAVGLWLLARRRWRPAFVLGIGLVGVLAAGHGLAGGAHTLAPLAGSSGRVTRASVWGPARQVLASRGVRTGSSARTAKVAAGRTLGPVAALVVVAAIAAFVVAERTRAGPLGIVVVAVLAYMLLGAYVFPWYAAVGAFCAVPVARWPPAAALFVHAALLQLVEVPGARFVHPLPRGVLPGGPLLLVQRTLMPPIELLLVGLLVVAFARRRATDP